MKNFFLFINGPFAGLVLLLSLTGPAGWAQAPAWQTAVAITGTQSYVTATATDANGTVYLAGQFTGTAVFGSTTLTSTGSGSDVFVAKWDRASSRFVWAQRAGGGTADIAMAIAVKGTSIFITGWFSSPSAAFGNTTLTNATPSTIDLFVAKLIDSGAAATFAWARQVGGSGSEYGTAIAVNGPNVYVAGLFNSPTLAIGSTILTNSGPLSPPTTNGFVCKLTDDGSTGNFSWTQPCGGQGHPNALAAAGTSIYVAGDFSGTVALGSTTMTTTSRADAFVAKLLDQGNTSSYSWAQQSSTPGNAQAQATAIAVSGANVYLTGFFFGGALFGATSLTGAGSNDVFIAKLIDTGPTAAFAWAMQAGGTDIDEAYAVVVSGPNVYVSGSIGSPAASFGPTTLAHTTNFYFSRDGFLTQLTDMGASAAFVWAKAIGGNGNDAINALAISGTSVFGAGYISPAAAFDNFSVPASAGLQIGFLASLTDPTLTATTPALSGVAFTLAPNPARAATTVRLPALPGTATATLTLRDALGRALRTQTAPTNASTELNLTGLAPGLYALHMRAGAATATRRLVVE